MVDELNKSLPRNETSAEVRSSEATMLEVAYGADVTKVEPPGLAIPVEDVMVG